MTGPADSSSPDGSGQDGILPTPQSFSSNFVAGAANPSTLISRTGYVAPPLLASDCTLYDLRRNRRQIALLITVAIALVVIPQLITYLHIKHTAAPPPLEGATSLKFPLARMISVSVSAMLLALSVFTALFRGHSNRDMTGVLILMVALNLPYLASPVTPDLGDLVKLALGNAMILAIWRIGAPVAGLRWVSIAISAVAVYSIVGGLILPEYMLYNFNVGSEKALVAGWELAGPFGNSNMLGIYCTIAFSLVPLIPMLRWRLLAAFILLAAIVASASRTAVLASGLVAVWWLICRFRTVISVRIVGTAFVCLTAAFMVVFPFLNWNPHDLSDRALVWAASISQWHKSPLVGSGVNWFLTDAPLAANTFSWAFVGHAHNVALDTLVKSGLLGIGVLVPVLLATLNSIRAFHVTEQIACFGFLIAFFVIGATEVVWALVPNFTLYPISGLVFTVLVLSKSGERAEAHS